LLQIELCGIAYQRPRELWRPLPAVINKWPLHKRRAVQRESQFHYT
jgi:hypothetical protein